jgi:hypothetical protein
MPDRLNGRGSSAVRSGKTAREWAQIARDRGDMAGAAEWEQAAQNGWDDEHHDPSVKQQHDRDAEAWAGKKGVFTNRA